MPSAILEKAARTLDFAQPVKMDALAAVGRVNVAKQALDQQSYPGFGYEISQGATSSWEEWTYSSNMETHDHAMFAGVNPSLYTQLGGQPTDRSGLQHGDHRPADPQQSPARDRVDRHPARHRRHLLDQDGQPTRPGRHRSDRDDRDRHGAALRSRPRQGHRHARRALAAKRRDRSRLLGRIGPLAFHDGWVTWLRAACQVTPAKKPREGPSSQPSFRHRQPCSARSILTSEEILRAHAGSRPDAWPAWAAHPGARHYLVPYTASSLIAICPPVWPLSFGRSAMTRT
ncbi:hypothetical protein FCI23_50140 [Actinacidiphila oryziradicis]|uniref:Alpha-L-rhamnosidase six-hairpin glycosidase domain-containing protein n=1 Tax=Actinacidiphila oryziradicis TaxID=2571141 RepID=A0A4U0RNZ9_9ACTN|nr:hypothetical protein FCI23_50140 [Actinacidiphila oryziradicis]